VGQESKCGRVVVVTDTISITGLRLTGFHGVFDFEKRDGQEFVIDLEVHLDLSQAGESDDLSHTLDYSALVEEVAGRVTGAPVDLIEKLAEEILDIVWSHPQPTRAVVTVHKPQAPVGHTVGDIAVTLDRERPTQ
jgi:dihydroneopterin aldolase